MPTVNRLPGVFSAPTLTSRRGAPLPTRRAQAFTPLTSARPGGAPVMAPGPVPLERLMPRVVLPPAVSRAPAMALRQAARENATRLSRVPPAAPPTLPLSTPTSSTPLATLDPRT